MVGMEEGSVWPEIENNGEPDGGSIGYTFLWLIRWQMDRSIKRINPLYHNRNFLLHDNFIIKTKLEFEKKFASKN